MAIKIDAFWQKNRKNEKYLHANVKNGFGRQYYFIERQTGAIRS
jgi:hypothetical protein